MLNYLKYEDDYQKLPIGYKPNQQALRCSRFEFISPTYKKDVIYSTNEFGLRNNYKKAEKLIAFAGCSMTFGTGISDDETYPYLVTKKLGNLWSFLNLGFPGSGPDVQMANITWAIDNFKIDKLCWYMSDPHRQIVLPEKDIINFYLPGDFNIFSGNTGLGKKFVRVKTLLEDTWWYKTKWNIRTIFSLCKAKNIELFMSCWQDHIDEDLMTLKQEYGVKKLGKLPGLDQARDNKHDGPISNEAFANIIYKNIRKK